MRAAVLGIDAAWTLTEPSGIALIKEVATGWEVVAAEASYQRFLAKADPRISREDRTSGSRPEPDKLIQAAKILCGTTIDLVAIDMPLARSPIVGRRSSDKAVSRAYGARKCSTHSPNASRPGKISNDLTEAFGSAGYTLCTEEIATPGLIEVYPHPALVEIANAEVRLPYKFGKVSRYWPLLAPAERKQHLLCQWDTIALLLAREISGVTASLPKLETQATNREWKAYEDTLDALVCAWIGVYALQGKARPFGDADSAIWIPSTELSGEAAVSASDDAKLLKTAPTR